MEDKFVTSLQALKLKELGFDEPCFGRFIQNKNGQWFVEDDEYMSWNGIDGIISAPTWSDAFDWFRNKHNYHSWIYPTGSGYYSFEIRPHKLKHYEEGVLYSYRTYEEARTACLEILLKIGENEFQN